MRAILNRCADVMLVPTSTSADVISILQEYTEDQINVCIEKLGNKSIHLNKTGKWLYEIMKRHVAYRKTTPSYVRRKCLTYRQRLSNHICYTPSREQHWPVYRGV